MTAPAWRWPLARNTIRRASISNTFGLVRRNSDGSKRAHQGWDLAARVGTPCYALGPGVVVEVGGGGDYGLTVLVRHDRTLADSPVWSFYAHLDRVDVAADQRIDASTQIGLTGDSGNAHGLPADDEHLHLEVRTTPHPGLGLGGRVSPFKLLRVCPLDHVVEDPRS